MPVNGHHPVSDRGLVTDAQNWNDKTDWEQARKRLHFSRLEQSWQEISNITRFKLR